MGLREGNKGVRGCRHVGESTQPRPGEATLHSAVVIRLPLVGSTPWCCRQHFRAKLRRKDRSRQRSDGR